MKEREFVLDHAKLPFPEAEVVVHKVVERGIGKGHSISDGEWGFNDDE